MIALLIFTFWFNYELAYCLSLVRPSLTSEELPLNEDQAIAGSLVKSLTDVDCNSYVLRYLNYICGNRIHIMPEKLRYGCLTPYTFTDRLCSADNGVLTEEIRQLLLTVRERRRPNAKQGNSATASYPPGFLASRGRRAGFDNASIFKQIDSSAAASTFYPSVYSNEI
ncbi:hypothetical protein CHUAL_002095 [Chamberlinius hualienensis]